MRSNAHPVLALIVVGLMFVVIASEAAHGLYLDEEFDTSTLRSQATIDQDWTTHGSKGGTHYHSRYHFVDEQGRSWIDSSEVAPATYQRLKVGAVVAVKYLSADPDQSRFDLPDEDKWHWHQDEILGCVGLFMGGFGLLFLFAKRR